jgi:formylglycine-generating enzyme required for sulfatase activity/serine/threonine protein kinase
MDTSHDFSGLRISEQIARDYEIIRLLGKGGMGEVYLAEQLRVGRRRVALKVLNRACSDNPELIKRFENEAASAGRVHHPNVVMIYESRVTDDGQVYVAMEYVEGKDLREIIKERGTLSLEDVIDITQQICAGLGAAHKLGIVHRDIKPDNIMISRGEDGARVVKLLDFGIARLLEGGTNSSATQTGVVMGTPYYMSPEQARGQTSDKIDSRSDIYSLGMVVYQMLTGKLAFESDSWMQVMYMHINERPLPPSQICPALGNFSEVENVILRALAKDREERPQTATQFATELVAAYKEAGSGELGTAPGVGSPSGASPKLSIDSSTPTVVAGGATPIPAGPPSTMTSSSPPEMTRPLSSVTPVTPPMPVMTRPLSPVTPATLPMPVTAAPLEAPNSTVAPGRGFWVGKKALAGSVIALLLVACGVGWFLTSRAGRRKARTPVMHGFSYSVFTLDPAGKIVDTRRSESHYFTEEGLGSNLGLEMVEIPAGTFMMGSPEALKKEYPDEAPQHEVSLERFYMSKYEITIVEWAAVARLPKIERDLSPDPSSFKADRKMPVQGVSWLEAKEFCARLSAETGRDYRLPSEAEWEYACRATTTTPFNLGATITSEVVNYDAHYPYAQAPKGVTRKMPTPVGNLGAPNAFGLSDMHGNMAEWCLDGWHENYVGAPTDGTEWVDRADPNFKVNRGGSWDDGGEDCRSAVRHKYPPDVKVSSVGFRVVAHHVRSTGQL